MHEHFGRLSKYKAIVKEVKDGDGGGW